MKRLAMLVAALSALPAARADSAYPVAPERAAENRAKVGAFAKDAYWKGAPVAACAVEAMSWIRRLPDLFPEDGDFTGPVRVMAAKGEYESGSFLLYGFEDATVELKAGDLVCGAARIPAAAIDLKVVKVWYQNGNGWDGNFFSDWTRRGPTPELLLHDEGLVDVDHVTRHYYVRCNYKEGTGYYWASFGGENADNASGRFTDISYRWIRDADAIRPFKVPKDEFKQLVFALHVPADAKAGLYRGSVAVTANGRKAFDLPLLVRVFPFALPRAATFRDPKRPFRAVFYTRYTDETPFIGCPEVAANVEAHNASAPTTEVKLTSRESAEALKATLDAAGVKDLVLGHELPDANVTLDYPPSATNRAYKAYCRQCAAFTNAIGTVREVFGPEVRAFAYGRDEARPPTVLAERAIFQACQAAGGAVNITTYFYPYLLFNVDWATIPAQARLSTKGPVAEALHAGNPDMIVSWYADPHSGPENPDYVRRLYGWQPWRAGYDMTDQYILFRNNWNDFWIPDEPQMRGLMRVYPQSRGIVDTLAWEGVREGMDDVRYATYLLQLCDEGRTSSDIGTAYAARAARTWVAQTDSERAQLGYLRAETIRRILQLRRLLGKGE